MTSGEEAHDANNREGNRSSELAVATKILNIDAYGYLEEIAMLKSRWADGCIGAGGPTYEDWKGVDGPGVIHVSLAQVGGDVFDLGSRLLSSCGIDHLSAIEWEASRTSESTMTYLTKHLVVESDFVRGSEVRKVNGADLENDVIGEDVERAFLSVEGDSTTAGGENESSTGRWSVIGFSGGC